MSDSGWKYSALQGLGSRIEVLAELYPRAYLLLATVFALAGYACLLLFPLMFLASMAGIYTSLADLTDVAWFQLLSWAFMAGVSGLISNRIIQFRPLLPAGLVLRREQAPDLFQLVKDTVEHYGGPGIDRIVMTGTYQLDIVSTPREAMPLGSTHSLVIGLPLMQSLSSTRFCCLLARRLGQFSHRTNLLLNWLYALREVWPRYRVPMVETHFALLPVHRVFSFYAPLYTAVSTAAARLDELQADSYAMELFSDMEVRDAITTDAVYRLYLREKYWPALRKLGMQDAAAITKTNTGMVKVLHAGIQEQNVAQWVDQAMSMEQQWYDPWPLLARRLENIGHTEARMDPHLADSAAEGYLASSRPELEAVLENIPPPGYPQMQPWSERIAGLQRRVESAMHGLVHRQRNTLHPGGHAG